MVVRSRWMGGVGMDETVELRDQYRCGKERMPERSAAKKRQGQFSDKAGREKKGGGQAMRKTESQAYERIAAG